MGALDRRQGEVHEQALPDIQEAVISASFQVDICHLGEPIFCASYLRLVPSPFRSPSAMRARPCGLHRRTRVTEELQAAAAVGSVALRRCCECWLLESAVFAHLAASKFSSLSLPALWLNLGKRLRTSLHFMRAGHIRHIDTLNMTPQIPQTPRRIHDSEAEVWAIDVSKVRNVNDVGSVIDDAHAGPEDCSLPWFRSGGLIHYLLPTLYSTSSTMAQVSLKANRRRKSRSSERIICSL